MIRSLSFFILLLIPFVLKGQAGEPDYPDLGLHGTVTWIDSVNIRVEYDWTDDAQLLDWDMTTGSFLVRDDGFVTVTDGSTTLVRAMIWKQKIKCTRIYVQDAMALSETGRHLNFYSNLTSFNGWWLPDPGLGAVLAAHKNFWAHNGDDMGSMGAPYITVGVPENYEYTASTEGMTIKSSIDDIVYSYNATCDLDVERKIALGGYAGNTQWGAITIEGEIVKPWQLDTIPEDMINFESHGSVFAPVIEVTGDPVIEWIFDDSTTSSSVTPVKDYGNEGTRHNYLRVTPWSSLIGINVGYDAADGGYGDFDLVENQHVLGFQNLNLAKNSLQYLCANYNPITELDVSEHTALRFIELYDCQNLSVLELGIHPELERLCVEDCNLNALDISGCEALEDLRAAFNNFPYINWGNTGQYLWHICIRENPQMEYNIPELTTFPQLLELRNANTNQTGFFLCHSPLIKIIRSYSNSYTGADMSLCSNLEVLALSDSKLSTLDIGTGSRLIDVELRDCELTELQIDYVISTLDIAGQTGGYLDITGNAEPSQEGKNHITNLILKGWTVEYVTGSEDTVYNPESMKIILTEDELRITLNDSLISWNAGLYNMGGIQVLEKPITSNEIVFNISSMPPGMYIIQLSGRTQKHTKKIIIP